MKMSHKPNNEIEAIDYRFKDSTPSSQPEEYVAHTTTDGSEYNEQASDT
jgi:hypothetical protein